MENIKYRILLIEDDTLDQMAFMRMAERNHFQYDCVVAASVAEARHLLGSKRFDVILADYLLGDGTAFDILDLSKNIPVIIVTGAGDEEIAVKAWKAGAADYLIKDHDRNYLKTVSITLENVINRKRTEEKLHLLSDAIMGSYDGIYITDMENKIIFVNRAFCEIYGYSEEEILGKSSRILWSEDTPPADRSMSPDINNHQAGSRHRRKDGSDFPVSLSKSVVRDKNGQEIAFIGVARDISDRLLVEDQIRDMNLKLTMGTRLVL